MTQGMPNTGLTSDDFKTIIYFAITIITALLGLVIAFVKFLHNDMKNAIKENTTALTPVIRQVDIHGIKIDVVTGRVDKHDGKLDDHDQEINEIKKNIHHHTILIAEIKNTK